MYNLRFKVLEIYMPSAFALEDPPPSLKLITILSLGKVKESLSTSCQLKVDFCSGLF